MGKEPESQRARERERERERDDAAAKVTRLGKYVFFDEISVKFSARRLRRGVVKGKLF